jgi:hypothetical protein
MKRSFACLPENYLSLSKAEKKRLRPLRWWVTNIEYPINWLCTLEWWNSLRFWLSQHTQLGAILLWNELDASYLRMTSRNGYSIFIAEEYAHASTYKRLTLASRYILDCFKS